MDIERYLIGIDLGTTNCTLAYVPLTSEETENAAIAQLAIEQLTAPGTQEELYSLPSFLYFPLQEELEEGRLKTSWDSENTFCLGTYARERGAEVPNRVLTSAKSWLCHNGIDRREKFLPLNAAEGQLLVSPLEAVSAFLKHMKEAWEQKFPSFPFREQEVAITVPASFDPGARQLVLEATTLAGYPEVSLLEEPQAAFYSWLHAKKASWRKELKVGDIILVIDIGGGTTDFSLIALEEVDGDLELKRLAVGAHLLLGGDNMDLALAFLARSKLEEAGHEIDDWQFQGLIHSCRKAKESLLSDQPQSSVEIAVLGRGRSVIKKTIKTVLDQKDVQLALLDAFFPLSSLQDRSPHEKTFGIKQIGLPYAQDARISCQIAKFLSMTGEGDSSSMDRFVLPSAVLFNGGVTKGQAIRKRILDLLNSWAKELGKEPVKELGEADYDFAVSRGAAYHSLAKRGQGIRIRGGTNRSYFIGVEEAMPAIPGMPIPMKAVCVVPFGMEEGTEIELSSQEFALVLGEQATFRFFSRSTKQLNSGDIPEVGTTLRRWKEELTELHPIETLLDRTEGDGRTVRIKLRSKVTELGVLELWCEENQGRRWKLEFDLRTAEPALAH